ncbi:MAG: hypothetical protein J6B87_00200 [Clostridia bacterium]|nr:hypothetical protein [Clostridia bacterium]
MKKKIFSLCIVIITLLVMFMCSTTNATIGNLVSIGKPSAQPIEGIKVGDIIGAIKWIGYIVAIGMIIWCGIKYVMSGAGDKAKAKETLIPIVIGAVLVVAGIEITAAVFKMFEQSV